MNLKGLTIKQPYAHLIMHSAAELGDVQKLVENRTWYMAYRGDLVIHAGKGRDMLDSGSIRRWGSDMLFGYALGLATVVDCINLKDITSVEIAESHPHKWALTHKWLEGPFAIVLDNVRRFTRPVSLRGQQGLYDVDPAFRSMPTVQVGGIPDVEPEPKEPKVFANRPRRRAMK